MKRNKRDRERRPPSLPSSTHLFNPPPPTLSPSRPCQREDRRRHRGPRRRRRRHPRLPPQELVQAGQGHLDLGLEEDVSEARRRVGGQGRGVAEARPQARRRGQGFGADARVEGAQGRRRGWRDRRRVGRGGEEEERRE